MPRYSYGGDPFDGVQYHNTSPDFGAAASALAPLIAMSAQNDANNRQMELQNAQRMSEDARLSAASTLSYMQEVRASRLQEAQLAMQAMKLGSEMREIDYRMDQARKLDDAKWRARDARSTFFSVSPDIERRLQKRDLLGADNLIKQAYQIPGITDDEVSLKLLSEYSSTLGRFTIDGRPAIEVFDKIKRSIESGGTGVADLKKALESSSGSDLSEVASSISGLSSKFTKYELEAFLGQGNHLMTPEKQDQLDQTLAGLRAQWMTELSALDGDDQEGRERLSRKYNSNKEAITQVFLRGSYDPLYSSEGPTTGASIDSVHTKLTKQLNDQIDLINSTMRDRAMLTGGHGIDLNSEAGREAYQEIMEKGSPEQKKALESLMSPVRFDRSKPYVVDQNNAEMQKLVRESGVLDAFDNVTFNPWNRETRRARQMQAALDAQATNLKLQIARLAHSPREARRADVESLLQSVGAYNEIARPLTGGADVFSGNVFENNFYGTLESSIRRNEAADQRMRNMLLRTATAPTAPAAPAAPASDAISQFAPVKPK